MHIMDGIVPAAAYTKVGTVWDEMDQPFIIPERFEYLRCPIRRMIVHDDNIEGEISLLRERRHDRITHRLLTVEDRDDYRSLYRKRLFIEIRLLVMCRVHQCADRRKVLGCYTLHLYLGLTVARVHIVELLHTAGTQAVFFLGAFHTGSDEDAGHTSRQTPSPLPLPL